MQQDDINQYLVACQSHGKYISILKKNQFEC